MKRLLYLTPLLLLLWRPARTRAAEVCAVAVRHTHTAEALERWAHELVAEPKRYAREQRHIRTWRIEHIECGPLVIEAPMLEGWLDEEPIAELELPAIAGAVIGDVYWAQAVPGAIGEGAKGDGDGWFGYGGPTGFGGVGISGGMGGGSTGVPGGGGGTGPGGSGGTGVSGVATVTPEPASLILLSTGMFAVVLGRRWG